MTMPEKILDKPLYEQPPLHDQVMKGLARLLERDLMVSVLPTPKFPLRRPPILEETAENKL
jgi:hypothetical protein